MEEDREGICLCTRFIETNKSPYCPPKSFPDNVGNNDEDVQGFNGEEEYGT